MQSYTNNVQDRQGNAIAGAQVLVLKDGAAAVIYSDNGITPATNPLTTDANGSFTFYGPTGNYNLTITSPKLPGPVEYIGIPILDQDDFDFTLRDDLASEASAKGSELVAYIPSGTGAVAATVQSKLREFVSVKDFGAVGDGVTDDSVAIQAATASGKRVYFPEGIYVASPVVVPSGSSLRWAGAGRYLTTIRLKAGANDHLVSFGSGAVSSEISGLTLDQNRAAQSAGHAVRLGGVDGLVMCDFRILNAYGYGIGIQAGANKNISITDFEINGSGDDAIDIKDLDLANENIVIGDGVLKNFGAINPEKPGIDVRGPAVVSNIFGVLQNTNTRGLLRLRAPGAQGRHGQGSFSNLRADCTTGTTGIALWTEAGVTDFAISNVTVRGGALGVIAGNGGVFSNLSMYDADGGQEALSIFATDTVFENITIDGCTRGIDFEAAATGNIVRGFRISNVSGTDAIRFNTTADNNTIECGSIPAGKTVSDSATGSSIRNVRNWKTAGNVLSASFAVDSTGSKSLTIPHGLNVTPNPEDVSLSVRIPSGGVNDWRYQLVQQEGSPNATNVFARVVVTAASATTGAVAHLAVQVRAKNS